MDRQLAPLGLVVTLFADLGCNDDDGTSPTFPPIVTITAPADGSIFPSGTDITFEGNATDPDGGSVTLSWRSSLDGFLGAGSPISHDDLSLGAHGIWLVGIDEDGESDSATVAISILGQPPTAPSFALEFEGAQATETPDADDLDLTTTFTIEMWIKPYDATGSLQHLVSKWGSGVDASYHLGISEDDGQFVLVDGFLQLGTRSAGANSFLVSTDVLTDSVWQHVAATFDNGEGRLYIDGQLDTVQAGLRVPQISPTLVSLGRQKSLDGFIGKYYSGVMDEVRIWSVARTAAEIVSSKDISLTGNEPGLVAYWSMDEGSGDIALDAAVNIHDMRLGDALGPDGADPTWVTPGKL